MSDATGCWTISDVPLQCGAMLPQLRLVYQTYGELASDRRNVILYPTPTVPNIETLTG